MTAIFENTVNDMSLSEVSPQDTIRKVVEEGLEARNLLNFIADGSVDEFKLSKKPPTSPRPQSVSPNPPTFELNKGINARLLPRSTKRHTSLARPKSRLRSASAGRNPDKSLRARYWTFLFENLHRAVDEIYQTCEMDESIVESKEAIMMLENYSKDFHALIQYININKNYEKTAPPNRPTSLAWEVRKSSPGKSLLKNVFIEKLTSGSSNAKRILCFDSPNDLMSNVKVENQSELSKNEEVTGLILSSNHMETPKADEVKPLNVSQENTSFGIKISVVPDSVDSVFPCNDSLVVKEICLMESKEPSLTIPINSQNITDEKILSESQEDVSLDHESASKDKTDDPQSSDQQNVSLESIVMETNAAILESETTSNADNLEREKTSNAAVLESVTTSTVVNLKSMKDSPNCESNKIKNTCITCNKSASCKVSNNRDKMAPSESTIINKMMRNKDSKINLRKSPVSKNEKDKVLNTTKEKANIESNSISTQTTAQPLSSLENKVQYKPENKLNNKKPVQNTAVQSLKTPSKSNQIKHSVLKSSLSSKKSVDSASCKHILRQGSVGNGEKSENVDFYNSGKCHGKLETASEKQKTVKSNVVESAIKRNISYVQSLSSRNKLEKSTSEQKVPRPLPSSLKLTQKSGSMSSLNKHQISQNLVRKTLSVEKIPEALKCNADEDSDGWEMVRSRNRSRNSPAKKLPFTGKNQESEAIQIAKLNQSRIGGFPYTNKSNLKNSNKVTKPDASKKTGRQASKNEEKEEVKLPKSDSVPSAPNKPDNLKTAVVKSQKSISDVEKMKNKCRFTKDQIDKIFKRKTAEVKQLKDALSSLVVRSCSLPDLHSRVETGSRKLSKTLSLSDQSLEKQKYSNINLFKKKLSEKSSVKNKGKKVRISDGVSNKASGNLDESDNGVNSDDQDGTMSHDEFDVQCQELYDAAWKYKILEQQVRKLELSWGEQMDLFDMELRTPGRALEMHEKLSSPFRKKSLLESIRLCNEKQLKAQEQRERLLEEKAQKFKIIEKKRLEMKALVEERQEKQRSIMEQKLQRAEEKRKKQLQMIIRKAHDEEEKVNEIAFINSLEAQNKRHDLIIKEKDHEARLQDIQEERQRKLDEKAAKEAAAEVRRKVLEAERLARLNEMQEKRKIRDHKVEQLFLVKEKERQELANQKARERELRLSALNAQQQNTIEELQKKIQLKQEESARRHEENMEQIRQKAFELSIRKCSSNNDDVPQPLPYETKKICSICNVLIGSEVYLLSHLHGKKHQEAVKVQYEGKDPSSEELELYNLKHIVDASTDQLDPNIALDKERQKALKKRCKKLRQRMSNRGKEYETAFLKLSSSVNNNAKNKMEKIQSEIHKLLSSNEKNRIDSNVFTTVDRLLNEMESLFRKQLSNDRDALLALGGVTALVNMFSIVSNGQMGNNAFSNKK